MKIIKKIKEKSWDIYGAKPVTIAFIGDSVTQGCFECYFDEKAVQTVFDVKSSYPTRVKEILNLLYPSAQINIVNSGISGDNAVNGNLRFERDITPFNPDLVVVSFGLNDSCGGRENISKYTQSLKSIFEKVKALNAECIFVFQNMLNTKVSCHLHDIREQDLGRTFAEIQNRGDVEFFCEKAKGVTQDSGVAFVDMYAVWKRMHENGVDTTELLSNRYNHPIREFHYYIAIKIIEKMFE
ncbi:MAG: SGNH/GDSL hydrolase family protein [Clostridiales bacterium]|nr:SGNH/GDSL hydrolase family protein [Clostridiales bacterium]